MRIVMRIAQVAPLWESVPPSGYDAVESLVADLSEALVARGHEVALFASGDSKTTADLVEICPQALHSVADVTEPEVYRMLQLADVRDRAGEFDVIHSHVHSNSGCLAVPMLAECRTPVVHTVHCFFNADNARLFRRFVDQRYVAISADQRRRLPEVPFTRTVHHGIDIDRFPYRDAPDDPPYLAFLGRIRPEKGAHLAIEVARRAGLPLKIAGRVKPQDRDYFAREIQPHRDRGLVEFVGELGFDAKLTFLGGAVACLATSQIPEPFGLVTVEAQACGTPVLGLRDGAVPELVADGVTGLLADSAESLAAAAGHLDYIDRAQCRRHVAERFSLARMVDGYEAIYRRALCEA
jgi:glycosyltransferase involved in cell wall biosynthesis